MVERFSHGIPIQNTPLTAIIGGRFTTGKPGKRDGSYSIGSSGRTISVLYQLVFSSGTRIKILEITRFPILNAFLNFNISKITAI
jgi:hypothetical protein